MTIEDPGTLEDPKRPGERERALLRSRKTSADTLFLIGLLVGGPTITVGGRFELGAFVVLAGAFASVLRRYTRWSLPGVVAIASLLAAVVASLVLEPASHVVEDALADEAARHAYAAALDAQQPDVLVEGRGPGEVTIWFTVSQEVAEECGEYPPPEVRAHLADLGFLRVVVTVPNQLGGLCSFVP